jgi:hypothetical protein
MRLSLQEIIAYHESMPVVEGATAIGGPEKQRIESSSIGIGQTRLDQGRANPRASGFRNHVDAADVAMQLGVARGIGKLLNNPQPKRSDYAVAEHGYETMPGSTRRQPSRHPSSASLQEGVLGLRQRIELSSELIA